MGARFTRGDRVAIAKTYHWAQDALGTVDDPPEVVASLARDWEGVCRMVQTINGLRPYYWVTFDEPHTDAEGDGPYDGAEIPEDALLEVR